MISAKKVAVFGCALAITVFLAGCATSNSGSTTVKDDDMSAIKEATITTRTVTFPAAYFQDVDEDEAKAKLEEAGGTDIVVGEDGSYTVTLPIDKYNELVDAMHNSVQETLDGIPNSEDYPSITDISYDGSFSEVMLTSSVDKLGLSEAFVTWTVGLSANMYQQIAGQPVSCNVSVVDPDGSVIQTGVFPDDFDRARESTTESH